jgi:transposase
MAVYGNLVTSLDDPTLRQVKMMMAALDPLGLPIAMDIVAGQNADDGLYIPVLERTLSCLQGKGKLVVGDCKLSALAIRAYIQAQGHYSLMPLSKARGGGPHRCPLGSKQE